MVIDEEVRRVRSGGRRAVDLLVAANAADPWLAWTLPDERARRSLFSMFLRSLAVPVGVTLAVGHPIRGLAVLTAPGVTPDEDEDLGAMVAALHGPRLGPALDAEALLDRHRPADEVWVLHLLAVDPPAQGRGAGGRLMAAAKELAAADGVPLVLETSSERAVRWYQGLDFTTVAEVDLSAHGLGEQAPTVWLMQLTPPA